MLSYFDGIIKRKKISGTLDNQWEVKAIYRRLTEDLIREFPFELIGSSPISCLMD